MAGSTFGTLFSVTTWGESHGKAIGVVIDGCPSGIPLCENDIQCVLNRRKPGQTPFSTSRNETDKVEILSGLFNGLTTGTPISLLVRNEDMHSKDYTNIKDCYRPGHADYTYDAKYGFRDYRGGGRSSGRETIGRVAAGAVALKVLEELGIKITAFTKAIGPVSIPSAEYIFEDIFSNVLYMPNNKYAAEAFVCLDTCLKIQESCGGVIECHVNGLPAGLGEPVFHKLDAMLAQAVMSIGSIKGVEIGDGFDSAQKLGSENNDVFRVKDNTVTKATNHSGGVLGGISDGSPLILRAAVKPTPSIPKEQHTVTSDMEDTTLTIHGRHDPVIVPRAVVVVEAMTAITILDMLMMNMSSRFENIKKLYFE